MALFISYLISFLFNDLPWYELSSMPISFNILNIFVSTLCSGFPFAVYIEGGQIMYCVPFLAFQQNNCGKGLGPSTSIHWHGDFLCPVHCYLPKFSHIALSMPPPFASMSFFSSPPRQIRPTCPFLWPCQRLFFLRMGIEARIASLPGEYGAMCS